MGDDNARSAVKASPGPWRWGWVDSDGDEGATDSLHDGNANPMGFYNEGMRSNPSREGNRTLIRLAPDMASILRSLEWSHCSESWGPACPVCGGHKDHGHHGEKINVNIKPPCRLAKLLSELPE